MICKKKNATSNVIHVGATGDSITKDVNNNLQKRTSEVLNYSSTLPTMGCKILLFVPMPPPPQFSFSYNHFCSLLKTPSARVKVCLYLCKMHFQDYSMQPRYFPLLCNEMHEIHFPPDVYKASCTRERIHFGSVLV